MSAPNIVGISSLIGITTYRSNLATSSQVILSNDSASDSIFRVISLMASNKNESPVSLTVSYWSQSSGAGSSISILHNALIPSGSTLVVIGRDAPLYLEENRSITAYAGVGTSIDIISSYEYIG